MDRAPFDVIGITLYTNLNSTIRQYIRCPFRPFNQTNPLRLKKITNTEHLDLIGALKPVPVHMRHTTIISIIFLNNGKSRTGQRFISHAQRPHHGPAKYAFSGSELTGDGNHIARLQSCRESGSDFNGV